MTSILKNIRTFGAQGRIDSSATELEDLAVRRDRLYKEMEEKQPIINELLLSVVNAKKNAILHLQEIRKIKKHLTVNDREIINVQLSTYEKLASIDNIELAISLGVTAANASKGLSAGLATATTTYFLVGEMAAASTGTAISTLSGAAASNATLAWLGGGTLAAGGGGVATGTLVVGGLVAIPALAMMGVFSHYSANKKIKEIKEKELDILGDIEKIEGVILSYKLIDERSNESLRCLDKGLSAFDSELRRCYKFLYPIPIISRAIKSIRNLCRINYFTKTELIEISRLLDLTKGVITIVEAKIVD